MSKDWVLIEASPRETWLVYEPRTGSSRRLPQPSVSALERDLSQPRRLVFQVVGHARNAGLIVQLWEFCRQHPDRVLVLVGPSAVFRQFVWKSDVSDRELFQHLQLLAQICRPDLGPEKSRRRMQSGEFLAECIPPSWHLAGPEDYAIYALLQDYFSGKLTRDSADLLLRCHPAWPALRFLGEFSWKAAVQVLCDLVDLRWFASPEISRLAALEFFFGVAPCYGERAYERCAGLMENPRKFPARWQRRAHLLELCLAKKSASSLGELMCWGISGRHYLWDAAEPYSGSLKGLACRRFLRILCDSWQDGLALARGARPPRLLDGENCFSFSDKALGHWQEIFQQCLLDSALRRI